MPVPATIEVCEKYLFADVNEMAADGIPELIQQRLIRLRDMYNYWLQFPRKKDLTGVLHGLRTKKTADDIGAKRRVQRG